ncbi:MAG: aminodeoxychorismate/anthranilate synthase component II [Bacteroidales bacterium]|nr:aminodeoxychorismate/anthranilate synthase component II [Bacteroidales bacterium]
MSRFLVIDNYDSFTYNLVYYIEKLTGEKVDVFRNDEIAIEAIDRYDKILLSPGPGIPDEAGICLDLIRRYAPGKSILGICLGHQAIAEAFGGTLLNLSRVHHGVASPVTILDNREPLFAGISGKLEAGRYHSWVVARDNLPDCFTVTCEDSEGIIMGISHKRHDVRGLQFHPESVLTESGIDIINNWIAMGKNESETGNIISETRSTKSKT